MDEDDIDSFDIPLRPKTRHVFKRKPQVNFDVSSSRKTTAVLIDNENETVNEFKEDGYELGSTTDVTQNIKVKPVFKKKQMDSDASFSRKSRTIPIDNDIDGDVEEEEEGEEIGIRIKPPSTFQRRDQSEPSKRRLNLSKYKISSKEDDVGAEAVKKVEKEKGLFKEPLNTSQAELENENPGNNPIIANIDKLDTILSPKKESSLPPDIKIRLPKPVNNEPSLTSQRLDALKLEFDKEDSEDNPVIANIDDLDFEFSPEKEPSVSPDVKIPSHRSASYEPPLTSQPHSPPPSLSRSYVPINPNAEPTLSKRQYLNKVASEYQDEKNYDDGAPSNQELRQPDFDPAPNNDYELSDEDMGVLKRNIDFENKYNDEIVSDYGSSDNDYGYNRHGLGNGSGYADCGYGYGFKNERRRPNMPNVKVYTIQEQIERIENALRLERAKQKQKEAAKVDLLKRKVEIRKQREELLKRLEDWRL